MAIQVPVIKGHRSDYVVSDAGTKDQPKEVVEGGDRQEITGRNHQGNLRPPEPCLGSLPACLAGYQHVVTGETRFGDILVRLGTIEEFAPIGLPVDGFGNNIAIYRKMPCAMHLDRDDIDPRTHLNVKPFGPHEYEIGDGKAKTDDCGKPPLAYLPWAGVDEVAMVQAYGHQKYKDFYNYRKGLEVGRNLSCAIRHIRAFMEGEDLDPESKRNHLAHACCRLLFTLQNIHDKKEIDDRFAKRK